MARKVPCGECGIEISATKGALCQTCPEYLCPACRPSHLEQCERHEDAQERLERSTPAQALQSPQLAEAPEVSDSAGLAQPQLPLPPQGPLTPGNFPALMSCFAARGVTATQLAEALGSAALWRGACQAWLAGEAVPSARMREDLRAVFHTLFPRT